MKNFRSLILPALAFGIAVSFVSCKKDEIIKPEENSPKYELSIRSEFNADRVGEEEDEDIIQGRFEDSNLNGIANAAIYLLDSGDSTITDSDFTDTNGNFEVSGLSGSYLFRISEGTNPPVYTDVFQLTEDVQITIQK